MDEPSDYYISGVSAAFRDSARTMKMEFPEARQRVEAFVYRFYPVLRHYRPEVVGSCLALSFDDPELGRRSEEGGFGLHMWAGNHPQDRDSALGSYRDDGYYLALQAYDYFTGALR